MLFHGQIRGHLKGWFLHSQASVIKPELQVLFTDATAGGWGGIELEKVDDVMGGVL